MPRTLLHSLFAPIRSHLPERVSSPLRAVATAALTPAYFSLHTGHWRSSLKKMAVSREGQPLPWYTYPCISFLTSREHSQRTVLEFGGGQSTMWWGRAAREVVTFEADRTWYEHLRGIVPSNVDLRFATMDSDAACLGDVRSQLATMKTQRYDVIVIDGMYRTELTSVALEVRAPDGIIICDDSEGYDFQQRMKDSGLQRVDFFGFAPGVIVPRCTSIFFDRSDLFSANIAIPSPVA